MLNKYRLENVNSDAKYSHKMLEKFNPMIGAGDGKQRQGRNRREKENIQCEQK